MSSIAKVVGIIVTIALSFVAGGKYQEVPSDFCEGVGDSPVATESSAE